MNKTGKRRVTLVGDYDPTVKARPDHEGCHETEQTEGKYEPPTIWLLKAGKIKVWDRQFPIEIRNPKTGELLRRHKVDFRVDELDGSFTLLEMKGFETRDWKMVCDEIEVLWLPEHPDFRYEVEK